MAIGILPKSEVEKENEMLNPQQIAEREEQLAILVEEKRAILMDDERHQ